jgi:hypothetical protein
MILVMSYKPFEHNGASNLFLLDLKPNCEMLELATHNLPLATFNSLLLKHRKFSVTMKDLLGGLTLHW